MELYVDKDSGTYGAGESIIFVNVPEGDELEFFEELADDDRIAVAKRLASNTDQPEYDVYSAHAAVVSLREEAANEHRYNPAPYCAKCGGPCEAHRG